MYLIHRKCLEESGIFPEIAAERGYRTTRSRSELVEFKTYQRRAWPVVPICSPDAITRSAQLRPDSPRKDPQGKPPKYETPGASRVILDVHPRMRSRVAGSEAGEDFWLTEGIKKCDALLDVEGLAESLREGALTRLSGRDEAAERVLCILF